jgi:hypothetical protein
MYSKLMFLSFIFFLVVSLSSFDSIRIGKKIKPPVLERTTIVPVKAAVKMAKPEFKTHVYFLKGKDFVPLNAKKNIKKLFENAKKGGEIYSAKIISWGDQLRPKNKKKALSSSQLKLVEDRNDNLEAYLERLDLHMKVMKISMAERPEVMDGLLSSDDRKLKEHLEFTTEPSASKSIVMFILNKKR